MDIERHIGKKDSLSVLDEQRYYDRLSPRGYDRHDSSRDAGTSITNIHTMLTTRTRLKVLSEIAEENEESSSPVKLASVEESKEEEAEILERRERRRKKIVSELFDTEKTYLHHLEVTEKYFEFPLRFNGLISERAHSQLFSNLEQILDVNRKLLEHMESTTVGTAFKFLGPFLKLYSMYANNHQQASAVLQESLQKNEKFSNFIHEEEKRPEVMGLKLGALLITPVQRIPRYKLLLEDLLENTTEDHHDYIHLKEAAKQVGQIALHINEHVRQHENFQKMLAIQNSFDSSAPKILAPGREFVKEGKLNKVSRRGGKAQERMFFLFSDMMIYGKPKLLDSGSNSYSCCCVLPLRHCSVERVLGSHQSSDGRGMFRVVCKEESLMLYCLDSDEALCWIEAIEAAIRKLNVNRQTLRKPSSNKVPVRGKSLIKMKLKEKKQDLKRRSMRRQKKAGLKDKSKSSPLRTSLRALADVDVTNCLSPTKRARTGSIGSTLTQSEEEDDKNEISLENWTPGQTENVDNIPQLRVDSDQHHTGQHSNRGSTCSQTSSQYSQSTASTSQYSEYVENMDGYSYYPESSSQMSQENSPSSSMLNMSDQSDSQDESDGDGSGSDDENCPDNSYVTNHCDINMETSCTATWMNPRFQKSSSPTCTAGPFRKVIEGGRNVTSSIGEAMDSVRNSKRCDIM